MRFVFSAEKIKSASYGLFDLATSQGGAWKEFMKIGKVCPRDGEDLLEECRNAGGLWRRKGTKYFEYSRELCACEAVKLMNAPWLVTLATQLKCTRNCVARILLVRA